MGKMGNAKKIIGILACGFLYSSMFLLPYIKYIFYDAVAAASGFNNTQIGFTLSIYIIASIIATIPSGYFADRFDPKLQLVVSGIGHAILSFLYLLFIDNYVMTLVIYFGLGITSILMFWSPCFKAVSLAGKPEDQGKLYGWFESFNGVGSMIMNFGALWAFGLVVGDDVGALKAVVIFYAVCSVISTLLVTFLYKSDIDALAADKAAQNAPKEKASTKEIFAVLKCRASGSSASSSSASTASTSAAATSRPTSPPCSASASPSPAPSPRSRTTAPALSARPSPA